ncbi:hypothetical protein [Bacillus atrophaeus]|uniref:hypothetical protein n=1 Tax=Bacillus atrophaeus TaxID=1452 RepID=UPI002E22B1B0|nr:hypothetical protein [Bacillus atrophaeus]
MKSDVAALKGEAEYTRIAKSKARAGDYVNFIETDDEDITIGELYEIEAIDCDDDPVFTDDIGQENYATSDDTYEVYRKVSAASVEAEPKPERLQVGDYAKVVQEPHRQNGEIVRLRDRGSERSDTFPFQSERLDGTTGDIFGHRHLVRATDEEVAEAKRVVASYSAERKKWAEIGREVGEYQEGDVVAYDDPTWFKNSGIGEVVGLSAEEPRVRAVNSRGDKLSYYLDPGKLRLITPVEARFDR